LRGGILEHLVVGWLGTYWAHSNSQSHLGGEQQWHSATKVRLLVNAIYRNGIPLFNSKEIVADSEISKPRDGSDIRVVTLRFAAPSGVAHQILHAFKTGEAELNIQEVLPLEK